MNRNALILITAILASTPVSACAKNQAQAQIQAPQTYTSIYWSDGDSGKIGDLKFRLANIDAPETRSLKQRGGAKCEAEREIGFEAKAFLVNFTKDKTLQIVRDYGEDRYGRLVIDLTANGEDVAAAGVTAGHLRAWPHKKGRAQFPKPDWCAK